MNRYSVNITCPRCGHRGDAEADFPCSHGPALSALVEALRAVLLFHAGGPWTGERAAEWERITGSPDATTRRLCDTARAALKLAEEGT